MACEGPIPIRSHKYRVCQGQLHVSFSDCKFSIYTKLAINKCPSKPPRDCHSYTPCLHVLCLILTVLVLFPCPIPWRTLTQITQWHIPMKKACPILSHPVPYGGVRE